MYKYTKKLSVLLILSLIMIYGGTSALAAGGYTIPGKEPTAGETSVPEETAAPDTEINEPEETAAPAESSVPAQTDAKHGYVIPGSETKPSAKPKNTDKPQSEAKSMSAQEYLSSITLAFVDGISAITPSNSDVIFRAAMVRVPEERIVTAQWYINGEPREDYYSADFKVYNGRMTSFEYYVPFTKDTEDSELTVMLELKSGGAIRRVEKRVRISNHGNEWYDNLEVERVFDIVKPVEIEATVKNWTYTYKDGSLSATNGSLDAGAYVYYMDHSGTYAAKIWIPEESRICWVPYYSIVISDKAYTVYEDFSETDKEIFVDAKGYSSNTDYLLWVNLERQKVNVFQGSEGNWKLIRVSSCSSGKNSTPTPTGVMTYCAYGNGWFHDTYYVKPVMYLNLERGIALHSILFNPNGTVQDGTQGRPVSHGCVRMPYDEIKWLADYIPVGTTVVVF